MGEGEKGTASGSELGREGLCQSSGLGLSCFEGTLRGSSSAQGQEGP